MTTATAPRCGYSYQEACLADLCFEVSHNVTDDLGRKHRQAFATFCGATAIQAVRSFVKYNPSLVGKPVDVSQHMPGSHTGCVYSKSWGSVIAPAPTEPDPVGLADWEDGRSWEAWCTFGREIYAAQSARISKRSIA